MSDARESLDVRTALLRLGWRPRGFAALNRGPVTWAESNAAGDSSVSRYDDKRPEWTIQFESAVPAHVVVATCEAAAKGSRRA